MTFTPDTPANARAFPSTLIKVDEDTTEEYGFLGWYDASGENKYDRYSDDMPAALTLYAKWPEKDPGTDDPGTDPGTDDPGGNGGRPAPGKPEVIETPPAVITGSLPDTVKISEKTRMLTAENIAGMLQSESLGGGSKLARLDPDSGNNVNGSGHSLTEADPESGVIAGTKDAILDALDAAAGAPGEDDADIDRDYMLPLPVFSAEAEEGSAVSAVTFQADLSGFEGILAGDIALLKLLNDGSYAEAERVYAVSELGHARYVLTGAQGKVIPEDEPIGSNLYLITVCIEDNSKYDWADETDGLIVDPLYVASRNGLSGGGDSGGGCASGAFAMAAMAAAVGLAHRRKNGTR
jgi:uncharacterized repeat protein (TIGR02543 family)